MLSDRFSSLTTCSRWRHETEPGQLDQSLSCRFWKVATHPPKTLEAFQQRCQTVGFELELGLHHKNLIAFMTGRSRFLTVGTSGVSTPQIGWTTSQGGEFTFNFPENNAGIDSPTPLSSPQTRARFS